MRMLWEKEIVNLREINDWMACRGAGQWDWYRVLAGALSNESGGGSHVWMVGVGAWKRERRRWVL